MVILKIVMGSPFLKFKHRFTVSLNAKEAGIFSYGSQV